MTLAPPGACGHPPALLLGQQAGRPKERGMAKLNAADRHAIRFLVDQHHVGTTLAEVRADIRQRAREHNADPDPALVRCYVRFADRVHRANRRLHLAVTSGVTS